MPTALDFDITTMEFAERLKALRLNLGLTQEQMGARLRVSKNYVWQMENGTKPGGPKIERDVERMEQALVEKPISARGGDIMRDVKLIQPRFVPVLTLAQAGKVMTSWDSLPEDWYDRVATDADDEKAVAIEIRGDSMLPHIRQGDRVVVTPSHEPHNGDVVVALFVNGDTVLKLYHELDGGKLISLASFNPEYPPTTYRRNEFRLIAPVHSLVKRMRTNPFQ